MSPISKSLGMVYVICVCIGVDAQSSSPGEAYLAAHGITNVEGVIYYKRVHNASGCLSTEDADSVLLQLCDARSVIEECVSKDEVILYDRCMRRQCTGKFSKAHTRCLLEKSGLDTLGHSDFALCSPPAVETGFFNWHTQAWALEAEKRNVFECIIAAPPATKIEYRLVCKGDDPILQHRIVFNSSEFLKTDNKRVQCLGIHKCEGPRIFHAELACYIINNKNTTMGVNLNQKSSTGGSYTDEETLTGDVKNEVESIATVKDDSDDVDTQDAIFVSTVDGDAVQSDEGSASSTVFSISTFWVASVLMMLVV